MAYVYTVEITSDKPLDESDRDVIEQAVSASGLTAYPEMLHRYSVTDFDLDPREE